MTVFIVRHGESIANINPKLAFHPDYKGIKDEEIGVTEWGYRQALEAGEVISEKLSEAEGASRKVKIFHSPFLRAKQTSQAIRSQLADKENVEVVEDSNLREQCFGLFNCVTDRRAIAKKWPKENAQFIAARKENRHTAKPPNGIDCDGAEIISESRADVVERAKQFLSDHAETLEDPNTDVIIVGHGMVNRTLEMVMLNKDVEWLRKEDNPKNCAVRVIENPAEQAVGDTVHEGKCRPYSLPQSHLVEPYEGGCKTSYAQASARHI
ncbi:MAG: histidine phosphatase family protein [Alphaproteobacteria bacterium]|nr:histidine phosphatase family protein [Alphaproteobacteria bacterium]